MQQYTCWEEMFQVTETDQEASTLADYVTDVCVPAQVAVKKDAEIFYGLALLNGLPTDPYADRREAAGVLAGAKEKELGFGHVEL